jgi:hypothetical protein
VSEIKKADLQVISDYERKNFEYGNDYSLKQLTKMYNEQYTKIIGAYDDGGQLVAYVIYTISDKIDILKLFVNPL